MGVLRNIRNANDRNCVRRGMRNPVQIQNIIAEITRRLNLEEGGVKAIAIDGRCASGKTTLAKELAEKLGAGVIHMDDFFLPGEMRTEERLREPGGNVHYERFAEEVLPELRSGASFSYGRFDCQRMETAERVIVPAGRLRIVEGVYSCHPYFGNYMDLRIFRDVPLEIQCERIRARNGEQALKNFRERWIPMEEAYFGAYGIIEQADIIMEKECVSNAATFLS